jgi:hypothetical protein
MKLLFFISVVALLFGCKKEEEKSPFQQAVAAMPNYEKECTQIQAATAALCKNKDASGACQLADTKQVAQAISVIANSPVLNEQHAKAMQEFVNLKNVTKADIDSAMTVFRICWVAPHRALWKGLFDSLAKLPENKEIISKLFEFRVFRDRFTNPTLVGVSTDYDITRDAIVAKAIEVDAEGLKFLDGLRGNLQKAVAPINQAFAQTLKEKDSKNFDPVKMHELVKLELKTAKAFRNNLIVWAKKYWPAPFKPVEPAK